MTPTTDRSLASFFSELRDPRVVGRSDHLLTDIVLIAICGTIAGADDFVALHDFAVAKRDWLRDRLGLTFPAGVPSHDTLNRVVSVLRPAALHECFLRWVEFASGRLKVRQIAIDGKVLCGSRRGACPALAIVSAWATEVGLTLAQVRAADKSNEITAIPTLLDLLDVSGALVTIDAAGCQKDIAAQIVAKGGDYLLAVKENQPRLYEDIDRLALEALEIDCAGLSQHRTDATDHGRAEVRFGFVVGALATIRDRDLWANLKSVVCVVSSRTLDGTTSVELRYYISSKSASAKTFLKAVRSHWSIENSCHWVLDVAFREDDHRLREGHGPENLALIRKMALAMLKKAKAKCGIKNKRLKAAWDDSFLEHILCDFLDD